MTVERKFAGEFWLAESDGSRQDGELCVAPMSAPLVRTKGMLRSPWRPAGESRSAGGRTFTSYEFAEERLITPTVILGMDNAGTALTLLDAMTARHGGPDATGMMQHHRGIRAIVGSHIDKDHRFTGVRVRLQNLEAWRHPLGAGRRAPELELADGGILTMTEVAEPDAAASPHVWISVHSASPASLRVLDRKVLRPLTTLFSLAIDTPCRPLAVQVQESPGLPWCDVYSAALCADGSQAGPDAWDQAGWLLQPGDLGAPNVGAWLNRAGLLGPLPSVVADLAHAPVVSLETQVLQLTTVAEGLHRRLYPDDKRMEEPVALNVRDAAAAAVAALHPKAADVVRGLLSHVEEPGYSGRLARLASAAAEAVPGVTGRTSTWKAVVCEARNEFAHRLRRGPIDDADVDRFLAVAASLRWLLTGLLLREAGFEASLVSARLAEHEPYLRLLASGREWQPRIYRSA